MKIVVLISGGASNLQDLLLRLGYASDKGDQIDKSNRSFATIVAVGSDNQRANLAFSASCGIDTFCVDFAKYKTRSEWDAALQDRVAKYDPDLVVLSGFMRILSPGFVDFFRNRIINTHPSFLPLFPGHRAVKDAIAAGVSETGASVIAVDCGVDTGKILAQEKVEILPEDTEGSLHARIKLVERRLLFDVIKGVYFEEIKL